VNVDGDVADRGCVPCPVDELATEAQVIASTCKPEEDDSADGHLIDAAALNEIVARFSENLVSGPMPNGPDRLLYLCWQDRRTNGSWPRTRLSSFAKRRPQTRRSSHAWPPVDLARKIKDILRHVRPPRHESADSTTWDRHRYLSSSRTSSERSAKAAHQVGWTDTLADFMEWLWLTRGDV
jgi:hypothetical protein